MKINEELKTRIYTLWSHEILSEKERDKLINRVKNKFKENEPNKKSNRPIQEPETW